MGIGNSCPKEPQAPKKQIFILSGQSNMAGRGGVTSSHPRKWDGILPPECRPDPNILRLSARLQWEHAHEPLHSDIDSKKTCGVGPGMAFANTVKTCLTSKGETSILGLVPCAVGGTAIAEWARGGELYGSMVKRAKEAVKGGGAEIKAILWYQGESDTSTQQEAVVYKEKMEKLIEDVRADLSLPSLPFIQVAIASGDKYMREVRAAQKSIDLPNVVYVDAKGLPLKADNLHLTTEAQVELGKMLADAYLKHFALNPPSSSVARL